MSVLIKGMEMPVIELDWTIRYGADGKWYAIDTNAETSDGKWHEIIPVPPHGDLIERDVLEQEFDKLVYHDSWYYNTLHHAPVIIPAEEGE